VLQKAFENLDIDTKRVLLDEFHLSTRKIMEDQFGSKCASNTSPHRTKACPDYVVQSVIAHGPDANRSKVIEELKGRVISSKLLIAYLGGSSGSLSVPPQICFQCVRESNHLCRS